MKITLQEPKVAELIEGEGEINLCWADVTHILDMGDGKIFDHEATGPDHVYRSMELLMQNSETLDSLRVAKGIILFFWTSPDTKLTELRDAAETIQDEVSSKCRILFGMSSDKKKHYTHIRAIIVG